MPAGQGQKQVTLWVTPEERDAFQALCKTTGTNASAALRRWMLLAIQEQSTELVVATNQQESAGGSVPPEMLRELMSRMTELERAMPVFDTDDLVRIRKEVLDGKFGSMRYRLGIVEAQIQSQGGSIAWESDSSKKQ